MRSTDTPQRPTVEFDGDLRIREGCFVPCAVQVWFALNPYDAMTIRVVAPAIEEEIKLPTEIRSRKGLYCSGGADIVLEGVWLRHWITGSLPARRNLHHLVQLASVHRIIVSSRSEEMPLESQRPKRLSARFHIRLSESAYLSPLSIARPDEKGVLTFDQRNHLKMRHPALGTTKFERVYRFSTGLDKDVHVSSELVALIGTPARDVSGGLDSRATVNEFEDLCLLASVASRHRVRIRGWKHAADREFEDAFADPLESSAGPAKLDEQDVLIDRRHAPAFLAHCVKAWASFSADEQRKLRYVCLTLAPTQEPTIEGSFLAMFPALEGLISIFRAREGREFVYGRPESWAAVRKQLAKAIDSMSLEDPQFNPGAIKRNLPALKRVPLAESTRAVLTGLRAWCDVLWPMFDNAAPSLSSIRNHLAHGEHLDPNKVGAVLVAGNHLRILLERTLCCALGWPLDDTHVSDAELLGQDWRFAREISGARAILAGIEPDPDAAAVLPVQIE